MNILWNEILALINGSSKKIQVEFNEICDYSMLKRLGLETDSVIGQVIANTKGIIIDNTVRILGSGEKNKFTSAEQYNREIGKYFGNEFFIIADDVFGGVFALKKTGINGDNTIYYLSPDTLEWEDLEIVYLEFLTFFLGDTSDEFYQPFKWKSFSKDVEGIKYDQGISIYPYLWSNECSIEEASKKIVPAMELIQLNIEFRKKFGIE
ncbi:MAG: DUF2625 domain-containing protein [Lachnospiraceae bacterium]|nr:DUF2625 domain-containing protein [Lachnospiraceae bacterium]